MVFRGTEITSIEDIVTDLRVEKFAGPLGGRVHAGFAAALELVLNEVVTELVPFDREEAGMRLWLTGRSLGGALPPTPAPPRSPGASCAG